MVNPERRATVEDIANHWWVNWGWKSSVCDCESQRDLGGSPMLARFIDWQNRAEPRGPGAKVPEPPLRQRPKKSKKENVEAGNPEGGAGDKPGLKRPKGILKTRVTEKQQLPASLQGAPLSPPCVHSVHRGGVEEATTPQREEDEEDEEDVGEEEGDVEEDEGEGPTLRGGSPAKTAPSLPKKGILKNNHQRESGYYSSPERSESSELLGGASMSLLAASPPRRAMGRKGILKRNGKYSTHSGLPSATTSAAPGPPPPLPDSGLSRSQSRPSSIVGEDGGSVLALSPASLGGAAEWHPTSPRHHPNIRACVSAENLLHLAHFKGFQALAPGHQGGAKFSRGPRIRGSPGDNGSFSLLGDLEDMTQVYQQALDISSKLT